MITFLSGTLKYFDLIIIEFDFRMKNYADLGEYYSPMVRGFFGHSEFQ